MGKNKKNFRLFFVFLTRSKTVVPHCPKCRDLPHFTPQTPSIPGYLPCCRDIQTKFIHYLIYKIPQTTKFANLLAKLYTIWQNPYNLAKVRGFAKLCTSITNRHVISGIKKPQKERLTSRPSEPLYAQNPLILSNFSLLLPNLSKNPMASILNRRLCRCQSCNRYTVR